MRSMVLQSFSNGRKQESEQMHPLKKTLTRDPIEAASRLHDRAVESRGQHKLAEAEALALRALRIMEEAVGPDHPDVANILNSLAGIHEDRGVYAVAEE